MTKSAMFVVVSGAVSLTVLALGSCTSVQPRPQCKAARLPFNAKYFVTAMEGACEGRVLTAEVLNVQSFAPDRRKAAGLPSMAIEPASVERALSAADEAMVAVPTRAEYSLGKFSTVEATDDDTCTVPVMDRDTRISVPAIPADLTVMPPRDAVEAVDLTYQWRNVRVLVSAPSNGIHFGADLTRTSGTGAEVCKVTYKVSAVYPSVPCGVDDLGQPQAEPDPSTGKPDPMACDPAASNGANGLSPDLSYACDPGTLLCVPSQKFPSYAKSRP
jgi:hypothetical protein